MLKRLLVGLLKGLVAGAAIGTLFQVALGWSTTAGLLGYLIAMGTGATAGILSGRPPWAQEAWIESVLKALVGLGLGALFYWLAVRFANVALPFAVVHAPRGTPWTSVPLLYAPPIAGIYGAFIELDNTGSAGKGGAKKGKAKAKARVAVDDPFELSVDKPLADEARRAR